MRKALLVAILAVSASAEAANAYYDFGWVTSQPGLGSVVLLGVAAVLVLRRRGSSQPSDRRRTA